MQIPATPLQRTWDAPYVVAPTLDRQPFVDGSHPSATRPFMNTKSKWYPQQARYIAPLMPYIKRAQYNTINGAANTQLAFGAAGSYRMTAESMRQYSVAALMQAQQNSYFKLANH